MDSGFYWYAFKRFALVTTIVVGFCLLPGPRSLIGGYLDYLWEPQSKASISHGVHLSLIHMCWLFGLEMPELGYPPEVEPQLTSIAIIISILCQLGVLSGLLVLWRLGLHAYYLRLAALDEIAEFGDEELDGATDPPKAGVVPAVEADSVKAANSPPAPKNSESPANGSAGGNRESAQSSGRTERQQRKLELADVDPMDLQRAERVVR